MSKLDLHIYFFLARKLSGNTPSHQLPLRPTQTILGMQKAAPVDTDS